MAARVGTDDDEYCWDRLKHSGEGGEERSKCWRGQTHTGVWTLLAVAEATQLVGHRQDDSRLGRAGNMAGHISRRHMRQEQAQYWVFPPVWLPHISAFPQGFWLLLRPGSLPSNIKFQLSCCWVKVFVVTVCAWLGCMCMGALVCGNVCLSDFASGYVYFAPFQWLYFP